MAVGYNCNAICHQCRMLKKDMMDAPSATHERFRHTTDTFLRECLKAGPASS